MMTCTLRAGGALLCLAGLLFYGFGTINPYPIRLAALSLVVGMGLLAWTWHEMPWPRDRVTVAVLLVLAYGASSLAWSPDWREGVLSLQMLAISAGLFICLRFTDRGWLGRAVPVVAALAVGGSLAYSFTDRLLFGGMGNENFQAEFLLPLIPLCLIGVATWRRGWTWAIPCASAAASYLAIWNLSNARWMGIAGLGALLMGALWLHGYRRFAAWLTIGGMAVAALLFPWWPVSSILQRLELSYNTTLMWLDRPLLGAGLGGFNYLYPFYQESHPAWIDGRSIHKLWLYAGATHNEFVQALAMFGIAGVALIAFAFGLIVNGYQDDALGRGGLAALAICLGMATVGFPFQNPSTAVVAIVALAAVAGPLDRRVHSGRKSVPVVSRSAG